MTDHDLGDLALSAGELLAVRSFEREIHAEGWAEPVTVARELATWNRLSARLNAYALSIEDYTNELCSRDLLALALDRIEGPALGRIVTTLAILDDRFLRASDDDREAVLSKFYRLDEGSGWWWRRIPREGPLSDYLAGRQA